MADDAVLLLTCGCGQKMKVPAGALGKTAACVKCGTKIKISENNTAPAAPAKKPREQAAPAEKPREQAAPATPKREEAPSSDDAPLKPPAPGRAGTDGAHIVKALAEKGLIDDRALAEARLVQKDLPRNIWEVLVDTGLVSTEDFHAFMGEQEGVVKIDLRNYNIPGDVVEFVPEDLVRRGVVFPVDKLGKLLTLGMACPIDSSIIIEVQERTGLKVKVMLCDLEDLRKTIKVFYPPDRLHVSYGDTFGKEMIREFGTAIENCEVAERVYNLDLLPPERRNAERLKAAVDANGPLRDVAATLALDPTVAAIALSVSNSAAYGFAKRVDNIDLAATLLGGETVGRILSSLESKDYGQAHADFDYEAFSKRARICSRAARAIADAAGSARVDTAQTAGLLHEIGRLALLAALPESYGAMSKDKSGDDLVAMEERVYHVSYTEAGYLVARRWNLPPGITEPIRHHRAPEGAAKSKEVVSIVSLASRMAEAHAAGKDSFLEDGDSLLQTLRLTREKVDAIFAQSASGDE